MYEVEIKRWNDKVGITKKTVFFQLFHKVDVGRFAKELNGAYYVDVEPDEIDLAQTVLSTANAVNTEYAKTLNEPVV